MRYLLDSNALAEPVKPRPNATFLRQFQLRSGDLALSSITWHEALFGMERLASGKRRAAIHEYLWQVVYPSMDILAYDKEAAAWHADQRARLERRGRKPPFADGQIAAVAAVNGCVLVTANTADFDAFHGLALENWVNDDGK